MENLRCFVRCCRRRSTIGLLGTLALLNLNAVFSIAADKGEISFTQDIRPILSDSCFHCHGNDEETQEAGLRLDIREAAVATGAIVPGDAAASLAYQRMMSDDEDLVMPPHHTHKILTDEEKENFRKWIDAGAVYEQHWAYRPVSQPDVPDENATSPIDAFVESKLRKFDLVRSEPADRATLVRRLFLDLTGLPPTSKDIQQFNNDDSEVAYERLVDRLLISEAFGERMAIFWLDLVRYADTIGYHSDNEMEVSAYRDYVIRAFNENKPFDEFSVEQLAGDLLADATEEQKVASGYNRLLQTTEEGGAQPKEYISIYAADRVRSISGVWLGQTMGCAQCHDHKYDPITMKDFYAMSAFFADIKERPVGKRVKNLHLYSKDEKAKLKSLKDQLVTIEQEESKYRDDFEVRRKSQLAWEAAFLSLSRAEDTQWRIPELSNISASAGKLKELGDGSFLLTGDVSKSSNYQFDIVLNQKISAIRLEALTDPSFKVENGFSTSNGNFVLTGFEANLGGKKLRIDSAKADFSQRDYEPAYAIDDVKESGWAVEGHRKREGRRVIVFRFKEPLSLLEKEPLRIRMLHESGISKHNIGRFRISVSNLDVADEELAFNGKTAPPEKIGKLVAIAQGLRTPEQQKQIDEAFIDQSKEFHEILGRETEVKRAIEELRDQARTMLVTESLSKPRVTKIKNRGDWMDESGEVLLPAVPEFLPSNFEHVDRRLNRLDLAHWLFESSNPLTSRTFVNRLWSIFFGRGLSNNLGDLGGQGEPPTHPELLDWLAFDFKQDWNIKRIVKKLVMTEAYRRSSIAAKDIVEHDPENRWYARQGRWRIDAEFVRDTALQLSGLLDRSQIGGRSVKPYQPAGYWQHLNFPKRKWQQDTGSKLYRRGLYTFWCRSFLHPSMLAFDAPTREECTARRARSNIPQQALALLNDPIFVEAARGFALRMMRFEGDTEQKIAFGWKEAVGREPVDGEIELLTELLQGQKRRFAGANQDAKALLRVGEQPIPKEIPVDELAAWTQVARAMLNAYETISRH